MRNKFAVLGNLIFVLAIVFIFVAPFSYLLYFIFYKLKGDPKNKLLDGWESLINSSAYFGIISIMLANFLFKYYSETVLAIVWLGSLVLSILIHNFNKGYSGV